MTIGVAQDAPDLARRLPDDLAGAPVQRVEFGLAVFAVSLVQLQDQPVAPGRQRGGVAIGILERAKALGPDRLASKVNAAQSPLAKTT